MVFQHFEPKSSKKQRFFNGFRLGEASLGPGPPGRASRGEPGRPGQTSRTSPGQACARPRWGNVGEGLQEVAVTEEVGRRSRVRAFRFPESASEGFLLYAPSPVDVDRAPPDAGTVPGP